MHARVSETAAVLAGGGTLLAPYRRSAHATAAVATMAPPEDSAR
jgi:hypothetical protein